MSEAKHTEGPWCVGPKNSVYKQDIDSKGRRRTHWMCQLILKTHAVIAKAKGGEA